MTNPSDFMPPIGLRGPFVQSVLASSKIRARGKNSMAAAQREVVVETSEGVRLQGFYSPHPENVSRGLLLLLHGWEGSADSTYVLCTGRYFYSRGYSIFRLNLRDHGNSHHLNPGLFFGTLFDEVFDAVRQASFLEPDRDFFIAGFSLGGNYALRISRRCTTDPIANLRHLVAISPALDPAKATVRIDRHPVFRHYFLKKWRKSLVRKQACFPDLYQFSDLFKEKTVLDTTEVLLRQYSGYSGAAEYFASYSLFDESLENVTVPTTIITAKDDPIIPVDDFFNLRLNGRSRLIIPAHGGHNGFINGYNLAAWYKRFMLELFESATFLSN